MKVQTVNHQSKLVRSLPVILARRYVWRVNVAGTYGGIANPLYATRYLLYALFIFALLATFCNQTTFADSSIVAWGSNYTDWGRWVGQATPPADSGFIAIAAGYAHSLGLKQDGSIVAWGWNGYGLCNIPSPNSGFMAISTNCEHNLGLKQDGSIVAWGRNYEGQCDIPSPNSGFIAIAAGWYHSLAFVPEPPIEALVDINPDSLNKNSKGQWVTVYITLPEGYDVGQIDASTIAITSLTGESCQPDYYQAADLSFPPQIGDWDEDGILDLTIKFDRQVLIANLCLDDVAVTVEGELSTGENFKGTDHIRVLDRGK